MIPAPDTPTTSLVTSHNRADERAPAPADSKAKIGPSLSADTQLYSDRADRDIRLATPRRSHTQRPPRTTRTGANGDSIQRTSGPGTPAPQPPKLPLGTLASESPARPRGTIVTMTTDSLRNVKDRFSDFVDRVEREHERVVVTRNGRPAAVLISLEDLDGLEATLEVLADSEAVRGLVEAEAAVAAGDVVRGVDAVKALRPSTRR
jgi:antitoxin YefM